MVCVQRLSLGSPTINNRATGVGPKQVGENPLNRNGRHPSYVYSG